MKVSNNMTNLSEYAATVKRLSVEKEKGIGEPSSYLPKQTMFNRLANATKDNFRK